MEEPTDREYVQQVREGNRQAFTGLMRRHQERVYWIARRFVGNHDEADDITQETFVKAYLGLGDFRHDAAFFTWLYRITVNLSLNLIRKKQVMAYLRESDLIARFLPGGEQPDDQLRGHDTERTLHRAVTMLPEKQRSVFILRFFEQMPYEEISEVLKTSVGALKANYHHAIRKIREQMSDVESGQHETASSKGYRRGGARTQGTAGAGP